MEENQNINAEVNKQKPIEEINNIVNLAIDNYNKQRQTFNERFDTNNEMLKEIYIKEVIDNG
jgi:hypothetical protein